MRYAPLKLLHLISQSDIEQNENLYQPILFCCDTLDFRDMYETLIITRKFHCCLLDFEVN